MWWWEGRRSGTWEKVEGVVVGVEDVVQGGSRRCGGERRGWVVVGQ